MSNQTYTVGQAVICQIQGLMFVQGATDSNVIDCVNINGIEYSIAKVNTRPATEAEILAEAVKHGWVTEILSTFSPQRYFHILKDNDGVWDWFNGSFAKADMNLKEYCDEGLIAHRLITALNLAV